MQIINGLGQLAGGIGILLMVFAVFPPFAPAVRIDRSADWSGIKVDITIRRPRMMMAGSLLLGISLIVLGILHLISTFGVAMR